MTRRAKHGVLAGVFFLLSLCLAPFLANADPGDWDGCFVNVTPATPETVVLPETHTLEVLFDFDESFIPADEHRSLIAVAREVRRRPPSSVTVEAHADKRGDEAYNLDLSQDRAQAVIDFLDAEGVAAGGAVAFGELRSSIPEGASDSARRPDRRAHVILHWEGETIPGEPEKRDIVTPYVRQFTLEDPPRTDPWVFTFNTQGHANGYRQIR